MMKNSNDNNNNNQIIRSRDRSYSDKAVENEIIILEKGKKEGGKILKENDFFYELNEVMQENTFRTFYDKYFNDTSDIKTALLYLKLYEKLEKEYKERNNGKAIDEKLLVYMMKQLMSNDNTRRHIVSSFSNYFETTSPVETSNKKTLYLMDILEDKDSESPST